jgi:hypothetical protein
MGSPINASKKFNKLQAVQVYKTVLPFVSPSHRAAACASIDTHINNRVTMFSTTPINATCSNLVVTHTVFTGSLVCGQGGYMSKQLSLGTCTSLPSGTGIFPKVYAKVLGRHCPDPTWISTRPPPTTAPPESALPASLQSCIQCTGTHSVTDSRLWYSFVEKPFYPGSTVTGKCVSGHDQLPCFSYYAYYCSQYTPYESKIQFYDSYGKCNPAAALAECKSCATQYWYFSSSLAFEPSGNNRSSAEYGTGACAASLSDVPCRNYYVPVRECKDWQFSVENRGPVLISKTCDPKFESISSSSSLVVSLSLVVAAFLALV